MNQQGRGNVNVPAGQLKGNDSANQLRPSPLKKDPKN